MTGQGKSSMLCSVGLVCIDLRVCAENSRADVCASADCECQCHTNSLPTYYTYVWCRHPYVSQQLGLFSVLPVPNGTGLQVEWVLFTSVVHAQQELASSTMTVISGWSTQQDGSPSAYPVAESGKLADGIDRHCWQYSWQPSHGHFRYPVIWHPTACRKGVWVCFCWCVMCRCSGKCMCTRAWRKPCQNHWSSECFFTDSTFVTFGFFSRSIVDCHELFGTQERHYPKLNYLRGGCRKY